MYIFFNGKSSSTNPARRLSSRIILEKGSHSDLIRFTFVSKTEQTGQHRGDAGNLFLLVHEWLTSDAGLEVDGHPLIDEGQQGQDVVAFAVPGQFLHQ